MNKTGTQTIETPRLLLRRFRPSDAEDMFRNWASDPEVTRYLTWPTHPDVEATRQLLRDWEAHYEDGAYFNWAIEDRQTGQVIGDISVVALNESIEAADIGYCLSRAAWGQGIMPEALKAVMDYLFDVVGLNRVAARHDVNNPKSGRVMEKCGMRLEGTLRASDRNNCGICDIVCRSMIRSDREASGELRVELQDHEWPFTHADHDRLIARAIVFDEDGWFYFVRAERHDEFGDATLIETSGGGVEPGEPLETAILRELGEELGAEAEIVCKIGLVSDYYNLIHRHNLNHYFLCRALSFGEKHLTRDEIEDFHLNTLKLTYEEAVCEYEKRRDSRLGRLIANRELPILRRAAEILRREKDGLRHSL